jgi:hypothetical protein
MLLALWKERKNHRHSLSIISILLTKQRDEISLFEEDANEDVTRGGHREKQVPLSHGRSRPESQDKAEIDRMADVLVECGRFELGCRNRCPPPVLKYLFQAEQFKVINQESCHKKDDPAQRGEGHQRRSRRLIFHIPHNIGERAPLPQEQGDREAGKENIGRALDGRRNITRPPLLESATRHDAVLYRKDAQKHGVDDNRGQSLAWRTAVDGLESRDALYKGDRVEKGGQKEQIDEDAVYECHKSHKYLPRLWIAGCQGGTGGVYAWSCLRVLRSAAIRSWAGFDYAGMRYFLGNRVSEPEGSPRFSFDDFNQISRLSALYPVFKIAWPSFPLSRTAVREKF